MFLLILKRDRDSRVQTRIKITANAIPCLYDHPWAFWWNAHLMDATVTVTLQNQKKNCIFKKIIYWKTPNKVPRTNRTFLFFLSVTSGILWATRHFFQLILGPFSTKTGSQKSFFWIFYGNIGPGSFAKISSKNRFWALFVNF